MTRIAKVSAATVAMRSSGQIMVAAEVSDLSDGNFGQLTNDRRRNHNAPDTKSSQDQETPKLVQVIDSTNSERPASCGHQDRGCDQQLLVVTSKDREEPQNDTSSCEDGEADRYSADSDL